MIGMIYNKIALNICIFTMLLTGKIYSQNVEFFKSYQNEDSLFWEVSDVIEGKDRYFYGCGIFSDSCKRWSGALIKMDSLGNVIKKIKYPDGGGDSYHSTLLWLADDTLLIVGYNYFAWADTGLNVVRIKEIISVDYRLSFVEAKFDWDSNLIVVGYGYNSTFKEDPIMYKFNKKMEYIASLSIRGGNKWEYCTDLLFHNKEYLFFTTFLQSNPIRVIRTDTNLNVLRKDTLQISPNVASYLKVRPIDSNRYEMLSSLGIKEVDVFEYDSLNPKTTHNYPIGREGFKSLDFIDTSRIFIGGTEKSWSPTHVCYSFPQNWEREGSKIVLARVRTDGDSCWVRYYGKDSADFKVTRVLALRDGGVLAIGSQFDFRDSVRKSGWFVIKVEGGICDTVVTGLDSRIGENDEGVLVLYPNPTNRVIYVQGVEGKTFRVLDMVGREVLKGVVGKEGLIELAMLVKGVYVVEIVGVGRGVVVRE